MQEEEYQPIPCGNYDYIELACVYHYDVLITCIDHSVYQGICMDTQARADKSEWLLLKHGEDILPIRMDHLESMKVLSPGAQFSEVQFN